METEATRPRRARPRPGPKRKWRTPNRTLMMKPLRKAMKEITTTEKWTIYLTPAGKSACFEKRKSSGTLIVRAKRAHWEPLLRHSRFSGSPSWGEAGSLRRQSRFSGTHLSIFFVKKWAFLYGSCSAARRSQLVGGNGMCSCCHMALVFAVMHLHNINFFLLLLSIPFFILF